MPARWLERLLLAYAVSLSLRRVLFLPVVGSKLQVPELIFLLLAPLALLVAGRKLWPGWSWFSGGLSGLTAIGLLSAVLSGATGSILEALGRGYLLLLLLIVAWYVRQRGKAGINKLLWAWTWGCVILAVVGYLGYGLGLAGVKTRWVILYENYPYFGTVFRAASTAGSPMATVMVVLLPFIWHWRNWRQPPAPRRGRKSGWFLALLGPLLLLTLSKEVLLVGMGCWLVDPWIRKRAAWFRYAPVVAGSLAFWFVTHYLVQLPQDYTERELAGVVFTGGRVALRTNDWQLTETSYLALKRMNWALAEEHPLVGVGPDRTEAFVDQMKEQGHYPENLPVYRPHSTWFGALAEVGWLGFTALLVVVLSLWRMARSLPVSEAGICLGAFFLLIFVAALNEEFLAMRFVYVAAGMVLGLNKIFFMSAVSQGAAKRHRRTSDL